MSALCIQNISPTALQRHDESWAGVTLPQKNGQSCGLRTCSVSVLALGGQGAHEDGPAGQHSELQPGGEARLILPGQHVAGVKGPARQVATSHCHLSLAYVSHRHLVQI